MQSPVDQEIRFRFGEYLFDARERVLRKNGQEVALSVTLTEILLALVENSGRILRKEQLMERVWPGRFVEEGNLARNVSFLRKSLDDDVREPKYIQTIPRRGYRFIAEVRVSGTEEAAEHSPQASRRGWTRRALLATGSLAGMAAVGRFFGGSTDATTAGPSIRSLVVLPLQSLSNDDQGEIFAQGMTDALITDLGRISALKVISRTTARKYKQTSKTLPEIARELGVEAVVEGSIAQSADKVRINVQLIDAATDKDLWAESYERDLEGVLTLQRDVARSIVQRIAVELSPDEQGRLYSKARPVDSEAHGHYVRGLFLKSDQTVESMQESIGHFAKAIARDPEFAPAYAETADAYLLLGSFLGPTVELWPIAREYAEKALRIDQTLAVAYAVTAGVTLCLDFNQYAAVKEFETTLRLSPSSTVALRRYGYALASLGRFSDAIPAVMRSIELDPLGGMGHVMLGRVLYIAGRFAEARLHLDRALELFPDRPLLLAVLGQVAMQTGDVTKAVAHFECAIERGGGPGIAEELAFAYAVAGRQSEARARADELLRSERYRGANSYGQSLIRLGLGDTDAALTWFEKACRGRDHRLLLANVDPMWKGLRGRSQFQRLTSELGLQPVARTKAS